MHLIYLLLLFSGGHLSPRALSREVAAVIDAAPYDDAHWGVVVYAPSRRRTLVARNADRFFRPASNQKILTTLAAFELLGPDFVYQTLIGRTGDMEGETLVGDLVVRGSGDPSFSGRYTGHADSAAMLADLARRVAASGVRLVRGDLVAEVGYFDEVSRAPSWEWDDVGRAYGVPVTALSFNDGLIDITLETDAWGTVQAGLWPADPSTTAFRIAESDDAAPPRLDRDWDTDQFVLHGRPEPCTVQRYTRAAARPTLTYLSALRGALAEAGVQVEGTLRISREAAPAWTPLVVHDAPPLADLARVLMKLSQNHYADVLVKTLGQVVTGTGSFDAGAAVVGRVVQDIAPGSAVPQMRDGSGLSPQNNLKPVHLISALRHGLDAPYAEAWLATLPVMGIDGTLKLRDEAGLRGRVWAKTGYINRTRALSGYLETAWGEPLVFCLMVNNYGCETAEVDRAMDRICGLMRRLRGPHGRQARTERGRLSRLLDGVPTDVFPLDAVP